MGIRSRQAANLAIWLAPNERELSCRNCFRLFLSVSIGSKYWASSFAHYPAALTKPQRTKITASIIIPFQIRPVSHKAFPRGRLDIYGSSSLSEISHSWSNFSSIALIFNILVTLSLCESKSRIISITPRATKIPRPRYLSTYSKISLII